MYSWGALKPEGYRDGYDHSFGDFNWQSSFTWSYNRNEIRQLAEGALNPVTGEPRKWLKVCTATVSLVGNNLWMIYCKAPFDPESVASTGLNYQGIDYFMMPSPPAPPVLRS